MLDGSRALHGLLYLATVGRLEDGRSSVHGGTDGGARGQTGGNFSSHRAT